MFESKAEALVNTVNLQGVMGKGIALRFKELFPTNFKLYQKACKENSIGLGRLLVTENDQILGPKFIINFPTKDNWKNNSLLSSIETGLEDLVKIITQYQIKSIAIPPLGCGNGGLDWNDVKPLIITKLTSIADYVEIEVFEPGNHGYVQTKKSVNRPGLTKPRALILGLADKYRVLGFDLSHLELQKLAYFLVVFGQSGLSLSFSKGHYGPYSANLSHLIKHLEGHYIKGQVRIVDQAPTAPIFLVDEHLDEVNQFLDLHLDAPERERLDQITSFIEGFESPFGLELLATTHFACRETNSTSIELVLPYIQQWNKRKAKIFDNRVVGIALQRVIAFDTIEP
jgi:O-acetyl-ADP-ribose deacetylase (regulator of RNase III)